MEADHHKIYIKYILIYYVYNFKFGIVNNQKYL